ncbi:MAG: hypothetical protein R3F59_27415 [Myxococcota bacterium]
MRRVCWLVWTVGCGVAEPDWLDRCDCGPAEICVDGGVGACQAVPDACADAFGGACDVAKNDDACTAALCGFALDDQGEIAGSWSIDAECYTVDGATERWMDCDAPLTF